jgi:arylsulfatase A-like enzyme
MKRRSFLKNSALAVGSTLLGPRILSEPARADATGATRPNLLFLMTDQQQSIALSLAGNKILPTPNLDALARSGAVFANAYSACPVCVPARTSILTGRSIRSTGVINNDAAERAGALTGQEGIFKCRTFDEVLVDNGYVAEYYGKWHTRNERGLKYANKPEVGQLPKLYKDFIAANKIPQPQPAGCVVDKTWGGAYMPDPLDQNYGDNAKLLAQLNGLPRRAKAEMARKLGIPASQGGEVGRAVVSAEHSITAYVAQQTISAIERLAKQTKPFSITCSIPPPHPPYIAPSPYYEMFPQKDMPLPASFRDPMANSPYEHSGNRIAWCQNPDTIGYLIGNYYGLVREADEWVGKILATLDRLNLRDNTLVVFLSDHGEMLGAHGMYSKMVFLDESSHIPMIFSHPGHIPKGREIVDPVGHIDVYATILDCLGVQAPASEGASLLPLMNGDTTAKRNPFTVSEWPEARVPNYMVRDSQWKLMFGNSPAARGLDALYDLKNDPYETRNLIGSNPDRNQYKSQAETMKDMLLAWLRQVNSPDIDGVTKRNILGSAIG